MQKDNLQSDEEKNNNYNKNYFIVIVLNCIIIKLFLL